MTAADPVIPALDKNKKTGKTKRYHTKMVFLIAWPVKTENSCKKRTFFN